MAPVGYNTMLTGYIKPDQDFIVCPNQDVVYGGGFTALDKEPTIFQVPDFGDRFWVYPLYDTRTDEIARIGKQYGNKPGFYMIAGRNWKGKVPTGVIAVVRSQTDLVFAIPRIQMDDTAEDRKAVQAPLSLVTMYPLSKFDGKMKSMSPRRMTSSSSLSSSAARFSRMASLSVSICIDIIFEFRALRSPSLLLAAPIPAVRRRGSCHPRLRRRIGCCHGGRLAVY